MRSCLCTCILNSKSFHWMMTLPAKLVVFQRYDLTSLCICFLTFIIFQSSSNVTFYYEILWQSYITIIFLPMSTFRVSVPLPFGCGFSGCRFPMLELIYRLYLHGFFPHWYCRMIKQHVCCYLRLLLMRSPCAMTWSMTSSWYCWFKKYWFALQEYFGDVGF